MSPPRDTFWDLSRSLLRSRYSQSRQRKSGGYERQARVRKICGQPVLCARRRKRLSRCRLAVISRGFRRGFRRPAPARLRRDLLGGYRAQLSPFLRFKGGKGVSTAIGGLLAVMFWAILAGLVVWLIVFYSTRYVSLASISLAVALPIASWLIYPTMHGHLYISLGLAVVIIVRHRSNIARLLKGTENRF